MFDFDFPGIDFLPAAPPDAAFVGPVQPSDDIAIVDLGAPIGLQLGGIALGGIAGAMLGGRRNRVMGAVVGSIVGGAAGGLAAVTAAGVSIFDVFAPTAGV